jgi:hypothetical protein
MLFAASHPERTAARVDDCDGVGRDRYGLGTPSHVTAAQKQHGHEGCEEADAGESRPEHL